MNLGNVICPKCGFEQPQGLECARCGVVFAKLRGTPAFAPPPPPPAQGDLADPAPGAFELAPEAPPPETTSPHPLPGDEPAASAFSGDVGVPPPPPSAGPVVSAFQARPRSFLPGDLLKEIFATYFGNFLAFFLLTALVHIPQLLILLAPPSTGLLWLSLFTSLFCASLASGVLSYGVLLSLRRQDIQLAECITVGFSHLLPVILVGLLQSLGIALGFVACIVPGVILALGWVVAIPATVEERPGIVQALSRSWALTEGRRGEIFVVNLVIWVMTLAISTGGTVVLLATGLLGPNNEGRAELAQLLLQLIGLIPAGLQATAAAVMYYRLRSVKESLDVEELASVFD